MSVLAEESLHIKQVPTVSYNTSWSYQLDETPPVNLSLVLAAEAVAKGGVEIASWEVAAWLHGGWCSTGVVQ